LLNEWYEHHKGECTYFMIKFLASEFPEYCEILEGLDARNNRI
jgi:hypothetical protein